MHPLSRSRLEQGSLCCLLLLGCIVGFGCLCGRCCRKCCKRHCSGSNCFRGCCWKWQGFCCAADWRDFLPWGSRSPVQPFSAWHVVRLEHFAADDHPCGSGAALADAIRDWSIVLLPLAARETLWLSNLFFCYAFHRQWEENMPHCRRLYLVRYAVILGLFSGLSLLCLGLQKLQALWI